jgi:hypothetical protein
VFPNDLRYSPAMKSWLSHNLLPDTTFTRKSVRALMQVSGLVYMYLCLNDTALIEARPMCGKLTSVAGCVACSDSINSCKALPLKKCVNFRYTLQPLRPKFSKVSPS